MRSHSLEGMGGEAEFDEAQNPGHVWVALLHEADVLRTRGGARITLATAFEFLEGPIWPHFGRPQFEKARPTQATSEPP